MRIEFVALNGNGISGANNENDLSVVAVVRFGGFDAVLAGDLSRRDGVTLQRHRNIMWRRSLRQVEVYKVNHHGSKYHTNRVWISTVKPKVAIVSAEFGHKHPTVAALSRMHDQNVRTYWTTPGDGADPNPQFDRIAGNILVETEPGSQFFSSSTTLDRCVTRCTRKPTCPLLYQERPLFSRPT